MNSLLNGIRRSHLWNVICSELKIKVEEAPGDYTKKRENSVAPRQ